jgi:hypothetical protein
MNSYMPDPPMTPMLARPATVGQATFEPDDEPAEEEPAEEEDEPAEDEDEPAEDEEEELVPAD